MALRLSHERLRLVGDTPAADDEAARVAALPTVARLTAITAGNSDGDGEGHSEQDWPDRAALPVLGDGDPDGDLGGDDDDDAECDAGMPTDADAGDDLSDEEFYADVMDSA